MAKEKLKINNYKLTRHFVLPNEAMQFYKKLSEQNNQKNVVILEGKFSDGDKISIKLRRKNRPTGEYRTRDFGGIKLSKEDIEREKKDSITAILFFQSMEYYYKGKLRKIRLLEFK